MFPQNIYIFLKCTSASYVTLNHSLNNNNNAWFDGTQIACQNILGYLDFP